MPNLKRCWKKRVLWIIKFSIRPPLYRYILAILFYTFHEDRGSRASRNKFRENLRLFSLLFGTQRNCTGHVLHFRQCENKQGFEKRFDARYSSDIISVSRSINRAWNANFLRVGKNFHSGTNDRINRIPSRYLGIKILTLVRMETRRIGQALFVLTSILEGVWAKFVW